MSTEAPDFYLPELLFPLTREQRLGLADELRVDPLVSEISEGMQRLRPADVGEAEWRDEADRLPRLCEVANRALLGMFSVRRRLAA